MDERTKKSNFLKLALGALLAVMTLLPEFDLFSLLSGSSSAGWIELCVRLVACICGGLALYAFYQDDSNKPGVPVLATMGGGLALALITCIPGVPGWVEWLPLILLIVGLCISRKALGVEWSAPASVGAYTILLAVVIHLYPNINDTFCVSIAVLVGLIMYIIGLGKFSAGLDANGASAVGKLKVAVWLSIVAIVIGLIPLIGSIIGGILGIIAFIFEFIGYSRLRKSETIGAEGQAGAGLLRSAMIYTLIAAILNFILGWVPGVGLIVSLICLVLTLLAMWYMFKGWRNILYGLER